jgi:ankyrin repeat protein
LKAAAAKWVIITNKQVWSIEILEDMIRRSVLHPESDGKATIYIDALDECESDQVRSAVEFFESLSRSATAEKKQFFILFSSRYYPHITVQSHEEVRLDTLVEHSSDIKTFLTSEFTIRSPFRSELQAKIEQRCSGIFLWVVLVVKLLKRSFDKGATRTQLHETLMSLPYELNELFDKITEAASSDFAIAMRWVLCARVSLHPEQLYYAIQIGSGRLSSDCWDASETNIDSIRSYILHVSRRLIDCTREGVQEEAAQFVHESVRQYLISRGTTESGNASSHELEIVSHARMLEDCQKYLELCARCRVKSLPPRDAEVNHEDGRHFMYAHPLLNYVLNYVFEHLNFAHNAGSIDHNVLDTFPLIDYVGLYNIRAGSIYHDDINIERQPKHYFILPDHTATLLTLLIWYHCYSLVDVALRYSARIGFRQNSSLKRGQRPARTSVAPGPDFVTCCGGFMPSPLHAAVASGKEDLVQLLLDNGAEVNIPGSMWLDGFLQRYRSPLMMAVEQSSTAIAKLLLEYGARVDTLSNLTGDSALQVACIGCNLEMVKLLLSKGATADLRSSPRNRHHSGEGWTALHIVCNLSRRFSKDSFPSVLRALLDAGADVNSTANDSVTPLIAAAGMGRLEVVKVLLDYGANTEYRSALYGTAITVAHPRIVEPLASEIRTRALQGRNRYLRPAPRSWIKQTRAPSRIAAPVRPRSRKREIALQ